MKMTYFSPLILDVAGNISLTASQQGKLESAGLLDKWADFLANNEGLIPEDFNPNDYDIPGFVLTDESTWDTVIEYFADWAE